jgi:hypothetical protein
MVLQAQSHDCFVYSTASVSAARLVQESRDKPTTTDALGGLLVDRS